MEVVKLQHSSWMKHRTNTDRPTVSMLRQLCDLRWPDIKQLFDSKVIIKCLSMTKYSIVTLVHACDQVYVMKECLHSSEMPDHVIAEIIMSAYIHDNKNIFETSVARCHGVCIHSNVTYLFSEYIPLYHHTLFTNRITYIPIYGRIIYRLAKILCLFEKNAIAHRDIKLANIAYRSSGELVLLDFDSATIGGYTDEHDVGTITTRAPEIYPSPNQYCMFRAQVWSLGIVWCEMLLAKQLFDSSLKLEQLQLFVAELDVCTTTRAKLLRRRITPRLYPILLNMLRLDPLERPTMYAVMLALEREW